MEPLDLPIEAIAAAVRAREITPLALIDAAVERVASRDGLLNAVVHVDAEGARDAARVVERAIVRGALPALAGVPFGVKESEPVAGWRSTHGDPLAVTPPASRDSVQVARLRAAGAIPLCATNLALYGAWSETDNPLFGPTRNPWDTSRVPGGSSGGSAAAVATRTLPFATGSDAGGSIRIPASACGVVGMKPTTGVVPVGDDLAPALGSVAVRGPLACTVAELAAVLDVVAGPSQRDPCSLVLNGRFGDAVARADVTGMRVAWSPTLGYAHTDARVVRLCARAVGLLADAGAQVEEVASILDGDPVPVFLLPFIVALTQQIRRTRGDVPVDDLGPTVANWVGRAAAVTADDLLAAHAERHRLVLRFAGFFEHFDVLVTPTTAQLPPRIPHPDNQWVELTHPFNLIGAPALSMPVGLAEDGATLLPVGVQIVAPRLHDLAVVAAASVLEDGVRGRLLVPPAPPLIQAHPHTRSRVSDC